VVWSEATQQDTFFESDMFDLCWGVPVATGNSRTAETCLVDGSRPSMHTLPAEIRLPRAEADRFAFAALSLLPAAREAAHDTTMGVICGGAARL
jgi:hypothetical protein